MKAETRHRFEDLVVASRPDPDALTREIGAGLRAEPQATLPAKYLYDDEGCRLFDRICELPEYYPTRTERALLARVAPDVARRSGARELVEIGSGMARKTHLLLEALGAHVRPVRYVPFDVSEAAVLQSSERLLAQYPLLRAAGVVGDFTRDLQSIPRGERRLVAFLGGTLGNFDEADAHAFLERVAALLGPDDHFLLAADLVKPRNLLHAAYNDAAGITARFNLNTLKRLQRDFQCVFPLDRFHHDAFFDEATSRIEIHARVESEVHLHVPALDVDRVFRPGESIRTEISRKFALPTLERMLRDAGMRVEQTYVAPMPYALVLARMG